MSNFCIAIYRVPVVTLCEKHYSRLWWQQCTVHINYKTYVLTPLSLRMMRLCETSRASRGLMTRLR